MNVRQQHEDYLGQAIYNTFYTTLANYMFNMKDITPHNVDNKFMVGMTSAFRHVLERSRMVEGILLESGDVVTLDNCPEKYRVLFGHLLTFKFNHVAAFDGMIREVLALDSFKQLNLKKFILEAMGMHQVTAELIRETFYNEMFIEAEHVINEGILPLSALKDQEFHIYYALPALTLIRAVENSRNSPGILLHNNIVLTKENCPPEEGFPMLVAAAFTLKAAFQPLSNNKITLIKRLLANDGDLPANLKPFNTPEIQRYVSMMQDIGQEISKRQIFNKTVSEVLSILCSAATPKP